MEKNNNDVDKDSTKCNVFLFDPSLLSSKVRWSESSFLTKYTCPTQPEDHLLMRPLCLNDCDKGYMQLLSQLTTTGEVSKEKFAMRFRSMLNCPNTYYIVVIEDTQLRQVVASCSLVLEQKFIHETAQRGRIEDVVVSKDYRGRQLGKLLLETLTLLSKELGCYKSTLECKDHLISFYESVGYKKDVGNNYLVNRF